MAQSGHTETDRYLSAFGAKADIASVMVAAELSPNLGDGRDQAAAI